MARPSTRDEQQLILSFDILDKILMNYLEKDQDILNFLLASKIYYEQFYDTLLLHNVLRGGCTALEGAAKKANKALIEKIVEIPIIEKVAPRNIWPRTVYHARTHPDLMQLLLQVDCVQASIDEEGRENVSKGKGIWRERTFEDSWLRVMWKAIEWDQVDAVERFLSLGLTVESCDEDGSTALFIAAAGFQKVPLVRLLLEKYRADPNKAAVNPAPFGQPYIFPLYVAAEQGNTEVVRLLLENNANPCAGEPGTFCHALALAVAGGHQDVMNILSRDARVELDAHDAEGLPILARAIMGGNTDSVQTLLENERINPNATTANGESPLMIAARGFDFRCVLGGLTMTKLLLADKRVDMFLEDNRGWNAMFHAANHGQPEILEMYLKDGRLDPNKGDNDLNTPVSHTKNEKCLELLINDPRVDLNKINSKGKTPLMQNASRMSRTVLQLLESGRVDVNQANRQGNTAMMVAILSHGQLYDWQAARNSSIVLCILHSEGVNLDLVNENGQTALMMAVKSRMTCVVQTILEMGHRMINIKDVDGFTMIEYAIWNKSIEIVKLLLETGEVQVTRGIIESAKSETIRDMLVRYRDKMEQ